MVDIKNVESADGAPCRSTINGSLGGEPTSSFIEKSDDVPVNEVVDTLPADEYHDESSSETTEQKKRGGGDVKIDIVESEPSTSQETRKIDTDTLFDKIGKLFELKTGGMISDLKLNIATSALALKK